MFGSTSPFGPSATATNNPFAPKPFGSPTTTFGAQTGSSLFGATSTAGGAFVQQQSTPTFGGSTPAFVASPPPAFGAASSTFGPGSLFGQKPSFGGFGSSPSQSTPFGCAFQQTFAGSTFGTTANPAFGTTTTPAFGATTAPAFGSTSSSLFGASSTPAFDSTAFGSSPFGLVTTTFGVSSTPGFGSSSTPLFGTTSAFSVGSSPSFGQTSVSSGSSPFGTTPSTCSVQTSPFGLHTAPSFVQGQYGKQAGGTRIKPYAQTPDDDDSTTRGTQPAGKLDSISAMPQYKYKSHEELRWKDYQRGDKGGPNPAGTPAATPSFQSPQPNLFNSSRITPNPNSFVSNIFASNPSAAGFATSTTPFSISFNTTSAASSSPFTPSTSYAMFGQGQFGNQAGGTRITPYAQTLDADSTTSGTQQVDSISAMPQYKDKSHEELRWEDYQRGDKGGPNPAGTPAVTPSFQSPQPNLFNSSQITPNPNTFVSNLFASNPYATGFATSMSPFNISFNTTSAASSSPFTSSTSSMFGQGQFCNEAGGTRIKPYAKTPDADSTTSGTQQVDSISAMPQYKDKCHEELRWEDYQRGDKGGPNPAGTPAVTPSFQSLQSNLFNSSQITPNPNSFVSNPFASDPSSTGFTSSTAPFNTSFNTTSAASLSPFTSSTCSAMFGQGQLGNQAGGTRIKPYAQTPDVDSTTIGTQPARKLDSISAMPQYKEQSHEELRWEDYKRGDKGGPNPAGTPAATPSFQSSQPNLFNSSQITPNLNSFVSNLFASNPSATGFATSMSPFNTSFNTTSAASSSPFTSSTSTAMFGQRGISAFPASTTPSLFADTTSAFATSSLFGSSTANNSSPFGTGLSLSNTQSAPLFQSIKALQPSSTPAFSGSLFSTPSSGSLFGSRPSLFSTPSAPAQTSNMFSFQSPIQPASTSGFPGFSSNTNQALVAQQTPSLSSMVMQPAPVSNPFGTLPAMPQMSIGNSGSSPSVQYGISSLPVALKPLPSRTLSMVVPRHLSQKRINLLPRKYNPISDGKVPFFADEEESPATPEADAFFIPRENLRNLIIRPIDQCPLRNGADRQSVPKDSADLERYKDASAESERVKVNMTPDSRLSLVENGSHHEHKAVTQEGSGSVTSVERLMPKLPQGDYFTEPSVEELVAKERAEPGYCCRVRDFVVGRHGYGNIKFLGEADVRGLDLKSIVEFNIREVIVYKDHSKKPAVGEGLNKAAEVTLLNVKCINKKTGEQYHDGPRVDRYREMLVKKAEEQGAEFVSFNVAKGEWKFRVKHFGT